MILATETVQQSLPTSDSKQNLKECAAAPSTPATSQQQAQAPTNHLEIPSNNPNLLSPDILSQRRGEHYIFICYFIRRANRYIDRLRIILYY